MQLATENIVKFLQESYSDESLAALLAHTQDGKLGFLSCCCLIGTSTANHALYGAGAKDQDDWTELFHCGGTHVMTARTRTEYGNAAETEFAVLGDSDTERRERLLPLIIAEQERREQFRLEEIDAEREALVSGRDPIHDSNGRW